VRGDRAEAEVPNPAQPEGREGVTLREMMARHAAGPLIRADHHGEPVTVTQGETETVVSAVVDRLDLEPSEATTRVSRLVALVFLPRSPLPRLPQDGDTVTLAMRLGDTATAARITRVVSQDEGGVLVEVAT
jgi:hypothetical protein